MVQQPQGGTPVQELSVTRTVTEAMAVIKDMQAQGMELAPVHELGRAALKQGGAVDPQGGSGATDDPGRADQSQHGEPGGHSARHRGGGVPSAAARQPLPGAGAAWRGAGTAHRRGRGAPPGAGGARDHPRWAPRGARLPTGRGREPPRLGDLPHRPAGARAASVERILFAVFTYENQKEGAATPFLIGERPTPPSHPRLAGHVHA